MKYALLILLLAAAPANASKHDWMDYSSLEMCRQMIVSYEAKPVQGTRYDYRQTEIDIAAKLQDLPWEPMETREQQTLRSFKRSRPQDQKWMLDFMCK